MRTKLSSMVSVGFAAFSLCAVAASAFAGGNDAASTVRGSLGASLTDLSLADGNGYLAFSVNAVFAVAFAMVALKLARQQPHTTGSIRRTYSSSRTVTENFG
jgi:hypothetical protein